MIYPLSWRVWGYGVWGLILLMGTGGVGSVMGQEPDPAEVQRLKEMYIREGEAEAKKSAPKPRPKPVVQPKPTPTVDHDREAWQSAEKCGTAACFEAYLEDYPKGRYAKMARARLNPEPAPQVPAITPQAPLNPSVQTMIETLTLGADCYFDFNQANLKPVRLAKLDGPLNFPVIRSPSWVWA